jgi:DNA-binding transcriptional LysR family regulator
MDTRFLQSFVCVIELGSIAAAARHLDLMPASVAQRLRALEVEIGTPLVVRVGRTVRPTLAGSRILEQARQVLREIRDMSSAASNTDLPAGPLRVGAVPSALTHIMPGVLKAWVDAYPHIKVWIEPGASTVLYPRVLSGELDAAMMIHPLFDVPKTCEWRRLRSEPLILLTPSDMDGGDALAVVAREPFIRYDHTTVGGRQADDYLRFRGVVPQVRFELDGIGNIAHLVASGLGVSLLPDCELGASLHGPTRKWPLPAPFPARQIGVLWQRGAAQSSLAEQFCRLAQAFIEAAPAATR